MENATRAFIMAAGVLLGVLILSLGIYLFSIFGQYSANVYETMEKNQITQFNSQFFKYYGNTTYSYVDENGEVGANNLKWQGKPNVLNYVLEHKDFYNELKRRVEEQIIQ